MTAQALAGRGARATLAFALTNVDDIVLLAGGPRSDKRRAPRDASGQGGADQKCYDHRLTPAQNERSM
jgi:hypothetical protein